MENGHNSVATIARSARRVDFTPAARSVIAAVCWRSGPQVVVLSWPAGAAYLPATCYVPGEFDVVIGHVEGCPIYTDARRLGLFANVRVVLDADPSSLSLPHPPLAAHTLPRWPSAGEEGDGSAGYSTPPSLMRKLIREMSPQFARFLPEPMISTYVREAIDDLRGSVSSESLPEMAARLARHRLTAVLHPPASPTQFRAPAR